MNAQEEWKFLYREMKKDMYFEKYDEAMTRRNSILREAALERKLAAAQREIERLRTKDNRTSAEVEIKIEKCPNCSVNDATEPHSCPYRADINNDPDSLCTCCADCEHECAMDI